MPLYDASGNAITKYKTSDGDSFQFEDSNGQWNTRLRLDYNSSETLNNTNMDERGQIIYNDPADLKYKKKEVEKLNSVLQGKAAFDNYKANAQQAKQVLDSIIKNYNVTLNVSGEQETTQGKYLSGNLVVDVNGKKIPLSSIMKNVGLGYDVNRQGVISGDQYLNEIKNGVTDVQSKMMKIDAMFKSGESKTRTDFSYVSGIPVSTSVTGNMINERTKANDRYIKHANQYIPQLAERLRSFDNIPGGEAVLFKMKQNPVGYGYATPGELEKDIDKDPIMVITKGLAYNQAAYAASIASDESNVVGNGAKASADLAYLEGLSVLGSGSKDSIAGFVDSVVSFNPDGSVGTHNRRTHLDRNAFGNQLMSDRASQGKGMWAVDRFFDGMANGTIIGNIAKYFGVADNASLNESIMRDVLGSDSDGLLMNAANITGNIAGMVTEAALMRKSAKIAGGGLSAKQISQMGNYSSIMQYGLHGTALPMIQAINEAEENPLWEQYIDKGWKESDITKVLADGLQNVATMYVGNRILEPIMGAMLKGQWLKKAMMVGKSLPANSDETIAKNLLNNIFANHVKYPALSLGSEILGDMGLDYASVKLTNDLAGMDGVEESLFTRSTTNALSNMFSEDMFARTLAQRFGARVFKNLSSRISDDVMVASGRKGKDDALMGEVKWYKQERKKYKEFNGTKKTMSASEQFTVWMSNAMFGNSLKSLDLSSRFLDNGFIDEAKKMDQDRTDIETKMNTTLLRWMIQENTLNVASKMFYGHLVTGTKNNWFKDTWTTKDGGKISIKDLYQAFQAGKTNENEDVMSTLNATASAINVANRTGIDSESSAKINTKNDTNASDEVVNKIIDAKTDSTSKRMFVRMLFSNANQDGFTNLKNSFDRLASDKIMNYKRNIESLKRANPNGISDSKIKELENNVKDVESLMQTIKKPNLEESVTRSFDEVSDEFFKVTGFKKGEAISDDQAKIVLSSISNALKPEENDTLWKLGLGNGLHSDEFKTLFAGLRESYKNILADKNTEAKDKLNLLFSGFSDKATKIIENTFNTFRQGIESTAMKSSATEAEKLNAIKSLNALKTLINLAPFASRQVYAKQVSGMLHNEKVFNMILTTKLKGELEGATDKAKFVSDMRDNLITEMLESASTLGAMREFMSIDTAAGKIENKAEIMRLFHSEDKADRLKAVRMLKAFDEPANNVDDNYLIIDHKNSTYDNFVFPNLIDVIEIEKSNDHVRIATNAMIGVAISRYEKKHYADSGNTEEKFDIQGNIITVNRNNSDGKNNYEVKILTNILASKIDNVVPHAIEIGKAFIHEVSGVNDDRHKAYMSFFRDEKSINAINGKTMPDLIDDVKSTFSTVDMYGVIRLLEGAIGDSNALVKRVVEDYVRPAIATMKGSYKEVDIENIAKSMIDGAMAYRSRSVSVKVNSSGKAIKATLSPNTIANTFTSVKSDTGFYAYMVNLEFPEGLTEEQKFDITNTYKKNNHVVSAGEFGNNLGTTLIQFSHDLSIKDNFEKFFTKEYSKSAFKDYVNAMNMSFNPKSGDKSFLELAYAEVINKESVDTFDKFSEKFAKVYGEMLIKEHERIAPPSKPEVKKDGDGEKEYSNIVTIETVSRYFNSIKNANSAIEVKIDDLINTFKNSKSMETVELLYALKEMKNSVKSVYKYISSQENSTKKIKPALLKDMDISEIDIADTASIVTELYDRLKYIDSISYQDINMKLASINESEFYVKMNQSLKDVEVFKYNFAGSAFDLSRDNIEMIKHTIESNTIDKRELMVRAMMAGSAAYTVDYASKRQSYFITAQVDPKVMAEHLLSGNKGNIKTLAIFAETDSDGNQVIPQDMVDALALGGDTASGKITMGMSKNQMISSKHLDEVQIRRLIEIAGYDNIKSQFNDKSFDDIISDIKAGIKDGTFDFIVLTPQSFKGMNIEILKSMASAPTGSGLIFAGNRSELFLKNGNDEFVHGLANGILDAATHAYNKTNADEKEASSQLESSVLGRSYLGTYLAKYDEDYTQSILNKGELVDINTFFEDVHRKILKSASIDKKVIGLTGKAIGVNLDTEKDIAINSSAEYNKLEVPSAIMGTKDLGALVLKIKDIREDIIASELGTRMMNGDKMSDDEIKSALNILVKNKIVKKFGDGDNAAYTMAAVRYPIVGGTNFTVVKLKGFKNGLDGVSIQLGVYSRLLSGDWDGDTVQLLQLGDDFFTRFAKDNAHLYTGDIYSMLKQNLLEMRVSSEISKISAKTTSDDAVKDIGSIGPILAKIQKFKGLLSYRFKMFNENALQGIANGAVYGTFHKVAKVDTTRTLEKGEKYTPTLIERADEIGDAGIKSSANFLEDQSRFIILKKNNNAYDAFGSLGGVKAGDNDLVLVREVGELRTYKRGEMYFTTIDDPKIPGFKRVIAASTDYGKIISFNEENTVNAGDLQKFDKQLLFMKDTVITSLDTLDRFWDGASTSRVKLEAVMTALGMDKEGANALEKLNEIQAASLISFNFTKDGVTVNNGSFKDIGDKDVNGLRQGVLDIAEYMKSNGHIKLSELEAMTKLTARQLPEGEELTKLMETLDGVLEDFSTTAQYIPNSLKGIMQVLYKLRQDSTGIGGTNVIQKLKDKGRIDDKFSIEFKDYASNSGKKFMMLKAATAVGRLIENFGINSAIGSSVNEKAFLKQTIDLISTKDAFLKSDLTVMRNDVERILNTTYKGQIKPTGNSLAEDINRLLNMANIEIVKKTELDNTRASLMRADVSKDNKLSTYNKGLAGDQKYAFVAKGESAKNVTVEVLVNKMSGIMLSKDSDVKEVDKAMANAILQSLDLASQTVVGLVSKGLSSTFLKAVETSTRDGRLKITEDIIDKYKPIPVIELDDSNKVNNILTAGVC